MSHKATFDVHHYPGSPFPSRIDWKCSCGKHGRIYDGAQAPTMKRAKQAHRRHVEATK